MEEPLPAGGSCLLGSINLSEFVINPFSENCSFDFDELKRVTRIAVKGLNEVLDEGLPLHPLLEQQSSVEEWRQIGLGIFGLADMLIKMNYVYGSLESLEFCEEVAKTIAQEAIMTSASIAEKLGTFKHYNFDEISRSDYFKNLNLSQEQIDYIKRVGLRNSQLLTIAPTGSLSTMLDVSGGIEPIFAREYDRKTESLSGKEEHETIRTSIVKECMNYFRIHKIEESPKTIIIASEIPASHRILMQATWQKYIDASISSTINLPEETTPTDVFNIYLLAWKQGLKGVTVFRENCSRVPVLSKNNKDNNVKTNELKRGEIIPISEDIIGLKRKLITGCGSLHCSAYFDPATGDLREIYLSKGSTGGCNNFMIGLSRMISEAARCGDSLDNIVDQLMSTGVCPSYAARTAMKRDTSKGSCCPMAVGYALKDMHKQFQELMLNKNVKTEVTNKDETKTYTFYPKCPTCGEPLVFEGGCNICKSCGWSKCE